MPAAIGLPIAAMLSAVALRRDGRFGSTWAIGSFVIPHPRDRFNRHRRDGPRTIVADESTVSRHWCGQSDHLDTGHVMLADLSALASIRLGQETRVIRSTKTDASRHADLLRFWGLMTLERERRPREPPRSHWIGLRRRSPAPE
jgi:hypothetical protein